jgi:hypothetical protein
MKKSEPFDKDEKDLKNKGLSDEGKPKTEVSVRKIIIDNSLKELPKIKNAKV